MILPFFEQTDEVPKLNVQNNLFYIQLGKQS